MADSYTDFADVYDELMDTVPYEEWRDRIIRLIETYGVSRPVRKAERDAENAPIRERYPEGEIPDTTAFEGNPEGDVEDILASERNLVLDLGCGTGTLTELLYRAGYDMIGVDVSDSMLAKAMEKKEETGSEILYLQQDMRDLSLYSTVGTVISVCDSINYILELDELKEVFSLVNNYLYPGGIFLFDFNTDYKYREVIGETVIAENRENCSFIWENDYEEEERINRYDLTLFLRREGDLFERTEETHFQRGYTPQEIREAVAGSGLELLEMRDADTEGEVTPESQRVYAVARERGKERRKDV